MAASASGMPPLTVLVTGSTGMIGSALVDRLGTGGHRVRRLVRSPRQTGESAFLWDPQKGTIDDAALANLDAAVHLAGETVSGRWTEAKRKRILESRVKGTRLLSESLGRLDRRPSVLVCASAIGYYGDRGDERLTEQSPGGAGFLTGVVRGWEEAARPAADAGVRVVHLRSGIVLSASGGALERMLLPFRLGLGGSFGDGSQYMSWISLDDELGAIEHALAAEQVAGPVNAVAPNPVTNREFAKTLARVLGRPAVVRTPALALRLALGGFARESLLASQRALPQRLLDSGYRFQHPELEGALRHLLGTR
jgi:uncharacterized protein (TIGR01777 family)